MRARSAPRQRWNVSQTCQLYACSFWLLRRLFNGQLVGCQRLAPELVELRAKGRQPVGIDPVDALLAGPHVDHKPGGLEDLQVLRNRRPGDRQVTSQLADRARMLDQQL